MTKLKKLIAISFIVFIGALPLTCSAEGIKDATESGPGIWDMISSWWHGEDAPSGVGEDPGTWGPGNFEITGHPVFLGNDVYNKKGHRFRIEILPHIGVSSMPAGIVQAISQYGNLKGVTGDSISNVKVMIIVDDDDSNFPVAEVLNTKHKQTMSANGVVDGKVYQAVMSMTPFQINGKLAFLIKLEEVLIHSH